VEAEEDAERERQLLDDHPGPVAEEFNLETSVLFVLLLAIFDGRLHEHSG
jgi:hypothetical protein